MSRLHAERSVAAGLCVTPRTGCSAASMTRWLTEAREPGPASRVEKFGLEELSQPRFVTSGRPAQFSDQQMVKLRTR